MELSTLDVAVIGITIIALKNTAATKNAQKFICLNIVCTSRCVSWTQGWLIASSLFVGTYEERLHWKSQEFVVSFHVLQVKPFMRETGRREWGALAAGENPSSRPTPHLKSHVVPTFSPTLKLFSVAFVLQVLVHEI